MVRDAPITTLRLLLRIANAFALDFLTISRGERDFVDALILAALMQSKSARLDHDPQQQWTYAFFETPVPARLRRPISINALASSLSLPFETVRRRAKQLIAEGLCVATPEGLQLTDALVCSEAHRRALDEAYRLIKALYARLARAGCLEPLDPLQLAAPFPPAEPPPLRIVWRAACDYFLRLVEVLPQVSSVTQAFVIMEVFRASSEHLPDEVRGGEAADAVVPDSERRPVRASQVAARLGLPNETTRRNILQLQEAGLIRRQRDGYIIPADVLARPQMLQAWRANSLSLGRMFSELAATGVLARWDLEQSAAVAIPSRINSL